MPMALASEDLERGQVAAAGAAARLRGDGVAERGSRTRRRRSRLPCWTMSTSVAASMRMTLQYSRYELRGGRNFFLAVNALARQQLNVLGQDVGRQRLGGVVQVGKAALFSLLDPGIFVAVAVEDDAAGARGERVAGSACAARRSKSGASSSCVGRIRRGSSGP